MLGSGMNLVTTVIGFGMSATFIVFICARLICGRIRSADSPAAAGLDIELRSELDQAEYTVSGLEPVLVAAIPTMKYDREAFRFKGDAQCSICLGDYEEKDILRIMPTCHHNFHLACIDVWLQKQTTCPICRLPLNTSFEAKFSSPQFGVVHSGNVLEINRTNSNQWLLPSSQYAGRSDSNQENHESVAVVSRVSHTRYAGRSDHNQENHESVAVVSRVFHTRYAGRSDSNQENHESVGSDLEHIV